MKKVILAVILYCSAAYPQKVEKDYPIKPVSFVNVKLTDNFWSPKLKINKDITIPLAFRKSEETGRVKNFKIAGGLEQGKFCTIYPFDDTDIYKNIEAASYVMQISPDPKLDEYVDTLINYIALAQEDDGYLYTNRTIDSVNTHEWAGKIRWIHDEVLSHELYNAGHLYEAAAAHYLATGKKSLLNIALKNAELVNKVIGWGKLEIVPGHQVIEMGLVKLYRITGEEKYLKLAQFFIDRRGKGDNVKHGEYAQMHKPFTEQDSAVGHAVRAEYMYSGAADIAALTGNREYITALDKIWEDVVYRKLYLTGGTGAVGGHEGFGLAYDLPNHNAYCETCASIANIYWNYRMFLLKGEAKYFDVLERILYNAFLSGISLSGDRFFYPNPLASAGKYQRSEWFGCACCPANMTRTLPAVPGYVYAVGSKGIYVNLFIQNTGRLEYAGQKIILEQKTNYPWDGRLEIKIIPEHESKFDVMIRVPGWATEQPVPGDLYSYKEKANLPIVISINGVEQKVVVENGYAIVNHYWKSGDLITVDIPMPVRKVVANGKITADIDRIALQRGPIVYCAEGIDNPHEKIFNLIVDTDSKLSTEFQQDFLNGVQVIKGKIKAADSTSNGKVEVKERELLAIPYYAWANRGPQEMNIWFAEKPEVAGQIP